MQSLVSDSHTLQRRILRILVLKSDIAEGQIQNLHEVDDFSLVTAM